jgi:outer membrane protein W
MKSKFCFALSAITALTSLALSTSAQAQSQGSWLVRGGIMQLAPQVTSGTLVCTVFAWRSNKREQQHATCGRRHLHAEQQCGH